MSICCCNHLFLTIMIIIAGRSTASHWTYGSQEQWPGECQTGQFQSPINLDYATSIRDDYDPFKFINYNTPYQASITNNGHTVVIRFKDSGIKLTGGGLSDNYIFEQLHFHWESEHTINYERIPLEMHLVHYAEKTGSFANALLYPSGVAVLGVLFYISADDDEYFEPFMKVLPTVAKTPGGQAVDITEQMMASNFLPRDRSGFFRYGGSLTTPTCNENVIWTVFTNKLPISEAQIAEFRNVWVEENTILTLNYRKIQPLNGRTVILRKSPKSVSLMLTFNSSTLLIPFLLMFL